MKPSYRRAAAFLGIGYAVFATGAPAQELSAHPGKAVFDLWCGGCHAPVGEGNVPLAGTSSLERKYQGSVPAALEERDDLTPEFIEQFVRNGVKSMPPFRMVEIDEQELADLIGYLTLTQQ